MIPFTDRATLNHAMKRDCLVIVSLPSEAKPLIEHWKLKPLRRNQTEERFQLSHNNGIYLAISGMGKVRSAIATSALLASKVCSTPNPIIANVGIAGSSINDLLPGTLVYINKIRDFASNVSFYPDVILKHRLPEAPLETHDTPVTTQLSNRAIVDMEASGFIQSALSFMAPSTVMILTVISDMCDGTKITPQDASTHIQGHVETIGHLVEGMRTHLPEPIALDDVDLKTLESIVSHAQLSTSQTHELTRCVTALKAQQKPFLAPLKNLLTKSITSKSERNAHFTELLETLYGGTIE